MCDNCKYFVYNLRWYIYYTVHTCVIVSFCFCKAVSSCIIIYKLNYSVLVIKCFALHNVWTCMITQTSFNFKKWLILIIPLGGIFFFFNSLLSLYTHTGLKYTHAHIGTIDMQLLGELLESWGCSEDPCKVVIVLDF